MQQTLSTLIFFWFKNLIQCLITSIVAVLSLEILSGRINGHSAPVDLAIFEIFSESVETIILEKILAFQNLTQKSQINFFTESRLSRVIFGNVLVFTCEKNFVFFKSMFIFKWVFAR